VGVIVCAYTVQRWALLERALMATLAQEPPPQQTLLVVDHANDLLERARRRFGDELDAIPNSSTKGLSGSRNTGLAAATTDLVVFLDDDATPRPGWLCDLVRPFSDPSVAGVGGWVEPAWELKRPAWWPQTFSWVVGCSYEGLPGPGKDLRNPIGASMALRRDLVWSAGGFDTDLGRVGADLAGCEETELCLRVADRWPTARFVHQPSSVVDHFVPAERARIGYFLRRCHGEGRSKAAVRRRSRSPVALGPEARHASRTIPRRALHDLVDMAPNLAGPRRAVVALVGTGAAATGYAQGRWRFRHEERA
jgi:glucosyl-dolichyl phosphate glucuronosyltransferase